MSTVARWTRRRAAMAHAPIPDLTIIDQESPNEQARYPWRTIGRFTYNFQMLRRILFASGRQSILSDRYSYSLGFSVSPL